MKHVAHAGHAEASEPPDVFVAVPSRGGGRPSHGRRGRVELDELIAHLGEPRHLVEEVVQQNDKTRFEVSGTRIRASQGHSLEGMPVTQEALEASWTIFDGGDSLWHGASAAERRLHAGSVRAFRLM